MKYTTAIIYKDHTPKKGMLASKDFSGRKPYLSAKQCQLEFLKELSVRKYVRPIFLKDLIDVGEAHVVVCTTDRFEQFRKGEIERVQAL